MDDSYIEAKEERAYGHTSVERLLKAIGYPERISEGSMSFTLRVDGAEVLAEEARGRLVLSSALTDDESLMPMLAAYAAGRMLKEKATLAYGIVGLSDGHGATPSKETAAKRTSESTFLWQDAPADADAHALLRLFETFMDSCDWWRARVAALRGGEPDASVPETLVIRP